MAGKLLIPSYTTDLDYPAYQDRLLMKSLGVQAGVVETEDFKVSAGSGKNVNVKTGKAFIEQTGAKQESSNAFYNGLYNVLNPVEQNPYNEVIVSASNPQIAQIILRVYDVEELGIGGSSFAQIEWLNGTPTSSATEAKMKEGVYEGAAALPQSSYRVAYVLVPKNATTSTEYYIQNMATCSSQELITRIASKATTAKPGERIVCIGGPYAVTLPTPLREQRPIEVWSLSPSITVSGGAKITGDFTFEQVTVTLLDGQHITLRTEGARYLITAGEPKREQKYVFKEFTKAEAEAGVEPSTSRPATVNMRCSSSGSSAVVVVEGESAGDAPAAGGGTAAIYVPSGQKWVAGQAMQTYTILL